MIKGISVVYLHSPHGEALADWYSEALGVPVTATHPGWIELGMPSGSRFAIDVTGYPRSVVEKQATIISFEVDDIRAAVDAMATMGVKFYPSREETIFDVGPSLVATFQDPDGNWAQLNQRK
jgi:predicted enzyme related to lactoylglutathione lyase